MFKRLNEILVLLKAESRVTQAFERRICMLEKRESELLDRLMAKNYAEYVLGKDVLDEENEKLVDLPLDSRDESAGEILETE